VNSGIYWKTHRLALFLDELSIPSWHFTRKKDNG
jgi:hypothetical protein